MNGKDPVSLDAMSSEFIAEIKDDLASLEPDLLAMEERGADVDEDLINHAFRSIHSIKGGAGFISFQSLSDLSHAMENVLMRVREKKLVITSEIVDALLSGFDKMKLMVELLGTGRTCEHEAEKAVLQQILNPDPDTTPKIVSKNENASEGRPPEKAKKTAAGKESSLQALKPLGDSAFFKDRVFHVEKKRLENALNSQKFVYAVYIRFEKDVTAKQRTADSILEDIQSIGDILYSDIEDSGQDTEGFFCVISTILDLPLLSQVMEVNRSQMVLVDRQFTDYETILKGFQTKPAPEPKPDSLNPEAAVDHTVAGESSKETPDAQFPPSVASQTIRINVDLISKLMNRAGELVLSRNQLKPILEQCARENSSAAGMMQNLDMVTADIQETIMQMRMQPIVDLMGKYKRVVRDIARRISKKVDFVLEGGDVEVDRNVLEKMANPVTHLIRNCIDHGIEAPEVRRSLSKPATGTISVQAFHQGGHVHLRISDDGAGIDPQLILSKAFEKGLVPEDELEHMTDKQKIDLIFLPGFSTSDEITDISGRGVGMDVVKTNIQRLRGQIEIESLKGEGTTVHLIIPLTLAIVPSLVVSTGEEKYAIPQVNIKEVLYLEPGEIHNQVETIAGSEVLRLREDMLPVLRLRNVLGIDTYIKKPGTGKIEKEKRKAIADRRQGQNKTEPRNKRRGNKDRRQPDWDPTHVIILKLGLNLFGLCVDDLHDIEEVVVEPLSEYINHLKCFAGTTILGNGEVIMILDVPGIAAFSSLRFDTIKNEQIKRLEQKEKARQDRVHKRSLIVFANREKEYFALALESVSRLEPFNPADIHRTGDLKFIKYQSQAVPLFPLDDLIRTDRCELAKEEAFAIFLKKSARPVGIIATHIIDTIETEQRLTRDETSPDAVLGKIFIDDMMVQVLDDQALVRLIEQKNSQRD